MHQGKALVLLQQPPSEQGTWNWCVCKKIRGHSIILKINAFTSVAFDSTENTQLKSEEVRWVRRGWNESNMKWEKMKLGRTGWWVCTRLKNIILWRENNARGLKMEDSKLKRERNPALSIVRSASCDGWVLYHSKLINHFIIVDARIFSLISPARPIHAYCFHISSCRLHSAIASIDSYAYAVAE